MERQTTQISIPYEREEQLRLISAATKRLKAEECWTRTQVNNAHDLMVAIVEAPRNDDGALAMASLAARMDITERTVQKVIKFAQRLGLVVVTKAAGPKRPHEYAVAFDALRGIEAGRPISPEPRPRSEIISERSEEISERSEEISERSEAPEVPNDRQLFPSDRKSYISERSEIFADDAPETYRHGHGHAHVIPNSSGASILEARAPSMDAASDSASATSTVAEHEEALTKEELERRHLERLIADRQAKALRSSPQRDPPTTQTILRRRTAAEPSSDGSQVATLPFHRSTFAREIRLLIDDAATDPRMFDDIAFYVDEGRVSAEAVRDEARRIADPNRKAPRSRGATLRTWFEGLFPVEFEPWRYANRRPAPQPSGFG